jgi:hypothetical protein
MIVAMTAAGMRASGAVASTTVVTVARGVVKAVARATVTATDLPVGAGACGCVAADSVVKL